MPYNLDSRNALVAPVDLDNLAEWLAGEMSQVETQSVQQVLKIVAMHLSDFVHFPSRAVLLWHGCDRVRPPGKKQKYHSYPQPLKVLAKQNDIRLDTRPNGPARAAFEIAGGVRPERFGSTNDWTAHHLYSGKFPYLGRSTTTHAIKDCSHFTQSAGVIAAHPIADGICDEFPFFAWFLRAIAFKRFGYDPDGVFSGKQDQFGFAEGHTCEIIVDLPDAVRTLAAKPVG